MNWEVYSCFTTQTKTNIIRIIPKNNVTMWCLKCKKSKPTYAIVAWPMRPTKHIKSKIQRHIPQHGICKKKHIMTQAFNECKFQLGILAQTSYPATPTFVRQDRQVVHLTARAEWSWQLPLPTQKIADSKIQSVHFYRRFLIKKIRCVHINEYWTKHHIALFLSTHFRSNALKNLVVTNWEIPNHDNCTGSNEL